MDGGAWCPWSHKESDTTERLHFTEKNWTVKRKRMTLGHYLTPYVKINSERIKELNIRLETIKLIGENIANKLLGIGTANDFLDLTPKAKATKAKIGLHQKKKASAQQKEDEEMK